MTENTIDFICGNTEKFESPILKTCSYAISFQFGEIGHCIKK